MDTLDHRETTAETQTCKVALAPFALVSREIFPDLLVAIYAKNAKLGLMLRIGNRASDTAFARSALQMFFKELPSLGVRQHDLTAYAIGGMPNSSRCPQFLEDLLASHRIVLAASDLGGNQNRSVWLSLDSGRLIVRGTSMPAAVTSLQILSSKRLAS